MFMCGSVVSIALAAQKVVGSIPRKHMYWLKMYNLNVSRFG